MDKFQDTGIGKIFFFFFFLFGRPWTSDTCLHPWSAGSHRLISPHLVCLFIFSFLFCFMCVCMSVCICTTCVQFPKEARRGRRMPWGWSYKSCKSSARAVSTANCWATFSHRPSLWSQGISPGQQGSLIPSPGQRIFLSVKDFRGQEIKQALTSGITWSSKSFSTVRETIVRAKRQPTKWEENLGI